MSPPAKLDHAELVSKDPAATQGFLERTFGFKFTVMGPEMGHYRMHGRSEGAAVAAIGIREPMGPEHPGAVPYVTVASLDETLKAAQAAGAKVLMPKTEIPGVGWTAMFVAPGEVTLGLFQNK